MSSNKSRRTAEQWQKLIAEQVASGQTQTVFCRERGIAFAAFNNARNRFTEKSGFIEITPANIPRTQSWEGEVVFPNGVTIRVRG